MGMYDSVKGKCPHCKQPVTLQSKAGICDLEEYSVDEVPPVVAEDLHNTKVDYNTTCDHCGGRFTLKALNLPRFVECKLIPLEEDEE